MWILQISLTELPFKASTTSNPTASSQEIPPTTALLMTPSPTSRAFGSETTDHDVYVLRIDCL